MYTLGKLGRGAGRRSNGRCRFLGSRTMTRGTICGVAIVSCVLTGPVAADILLFDLEDPQESADFFTAVETWTVLAFYDLDSLPDLGLLGIDGPLTSEGSGPIPPGFIPEGITLDSNLEPFGEGGPSTRGPGGNGLAESAPAQASGTLQTLWLPTSMWTASISSSHPATSGAGRTG